MRTDRIATTAESAPAQRRVLVGFGEIGTLDNFLLGIWSGASESDEDAKEQALEALWDSRLEVASCSPRFVVTNLDLISSLAASESTIHLALDGLAVSTLSGRQLLLSPVPARQMPSMDSQLWLQFIQGFHPDGALSPKQASRVQMFMRAHGTESLTDGESFLTLGGDHLAFCNPTVAQSSPACENTNSDECGQDQFVEPVF